MEYIIKNGKAREVIGRYKTMKDPDTGKVYAQRLKAIYRVLKGVPVLLWELIHSCFGSGYWRNDLPWSNTDGWKNGT